MVDHVFNERVLSLILDGSSLGAPLHLLYDQRVVELFTKKEVVLVLLAKAVYSIDNENSSESNSI